MRKAALGFLFALCLPAQHALAELAQSVGLSKIETNDLRLLYYDPLQTYLTPYVGAGIRELVRFPAPDFRLDAVGQTKCSTERSFG